MNPYLAEIIGTALLILLGNGVVATVVLKQSKGQNGGWIVITVGWGLAVAFAVYAVGQVSGAHINPAVTLALASIGAFPWEQVVGYILAQTLGAAIGATLVYLAYLAHWEVTDDPGGKRACFCTEPAIRKFGPAFITEFIGAAVLLFGVLVIGQIASGVDTPDAAWTAAVSSYFGPLLVGLLVLSIGLSLGGPTGYAINPARDLGPRIAHALLPIAGKGPSDWAYAWVPIVAPVLGGIAGAQLFQALNF